MIDPKYLVELYDGMEVLDESGRKKEAKVICCWDYEKTQVAGDTHYKFKVKNNVYSIAKSKVYRIKEFA